MSETNLDYCGVIRLYYDGAKTELKKEYFINAGKIEGICKSYHLDGQLWSEVNYIDGKKV